MLEMLASPQFFLFSSTQQFQTAIWVLEDFLFIAGVADRVLEQ